MTLETLFQNQVIWRGREQLKAQPADYIATGYPALDSQLPGGGWPRRALSEILYKDEGIGELELLMPALARLSQEPRWIVWIAPPHPPHAPALGARGLELSRLLFVRAVDAKDNLWALEQALHSATCSAVLSWLPSMITERQLRRLQLATEESHTPAFLFRPEAAANNASPAALRLQLEPLSTGLRLHILKCRGGWIRKPIDVGPLHAVA